MRGIEVDQKADHPSSGFEAQEKVALMNNTFFDPASAPLFLLFFATSAVNAESRP
jgi:hypothetical protein